MQVEFDTLYECLSAQHEKCPTWLVSAHPRPAAKIHCVCPCHAPPRRTEDVVMEDVLAGVQGKPGEGR